MHPLVSCNYQITKHENMNGNIVNCTASSIIKFRGKNYIVTVYFCNLDYSAGPSMWPRLLQTHWCYNWWTTTSTWWHFKITPFQTLISPYKVKLSYYITCAICLFFIFILLGFIGYIIYIYKKWLSIKVFYNQYSQINNFVKSI